MNAPVRSGSPRVSIVIPTRDGAATLPHLLDAIARQRVDVPVEVVAIDSSSTDGTPELLRARADRFISIPAETFDHGATRNAGIAASSGDLVVLTVQDAVPADDEWLAALIAPLRSDEMLAGTFARQRPRAGASALTRHYLAQWSGASPRARVVSVDGPGEFARLTPLERLERCTFDNVCSCIRRSAWQVHPFRPARIAEDLEWAKTVLLAGHRLAYVPDAVVVHSHERSLRYEFDRAYEVHRQLAALFGLRTIADVPALARAVGSSLALHLRCRDEQGRRARLGRAVGLGIVWPLGQYLGGRSAARRAAPIRVEPA